MLSKKTKYALKAILYLARMYDAGPILISDLSSREGIPRKFLELILLSLKNNGLLRSRKGRGGGYFLGRPPREISIGTVIRIMEGPVALVPCVAGAHQGACRECLDERTCGIRMVMLDVHAATALILDGTSLADMLEREELEKQIIKGVYNYAI